jgi:hypothetical protein
MVIMNTVNKDKLTGREERQNIALHVLTLQIKLLKCCLLSNCITIRVETNCIETYRIYQHHLVPVRRYDNP